MLKKAARAMPPHGTVQLTIRFGLLFAHQVYRWVRDAFARIWKEHGDVPVLLPYMVLGLCKVCVRRALQSMYGVYLHKWDKVLLISIIQSLTGTIARRLPRLGSLTRRISRGHSLPFWPLSSFR
jgi:hypothetical protein